MPSTTASLNDESRMGEEVEEKVGEMTRRRRKREKDPLETEKGEGEERNNQNNNSSSSSASSPSSTADDPTILAKYTPVTLPAECDHRRARRKSEVHRQSCQEAEKLHWTSTEQGNFGLNLRALDLHKFLKRA